MQIIQQTTQITAQEEVQNARVMYSYGFEKDSFPYSVSFSVARKDETNQNSPTYYTSIQGTVTAHEFNVQNNSFQVSDIELYKHIHEVCAAIINGQTTNDKSQAEQ